MRDLASLYRAWRQLEAYEARGLKPVYHDAVFSEVHIPSREDRACIGDGVLVAQLLETIFKPQQPRMGRL